MNLSSIFLALICALCFSPITAQAELPLTVEGLLTAQNRWRAELGINYSNAESQGVSTGQSVSVPISSSQYVTIPTQISASNFNTDTIVITPSLRYGLSENTEIYGHAAWFSSSTRTQDLNGFASQSISRFESLWLGVNHKLIEEGKSPALLGFAEISIAEKSQLPGTSDMRTVSGKSALAGFTTYRVIDPIVLVFTAAYRLNAVREISGQSYRPGNYLMFSPSTSFAVNNDISLSAGIQWRNVRPDAINGQALNMLRTSTDLNLDLAWQWDERSTLNIGCSANLSGGAGASLGVTWSGKLGELPTRKTPDKPVAP